MNTSLTATAAGVGLGGLPKINDRAVGARLARPVCQTRYLPGRYAPIMYSGRAMRAPTVFTQDSAAGFCGRILRQDSRAVCYVFMRLTCCDTPSAREIFFMVILTAITIHS
jgi:hypothetical protein